MAVKLPSFPKEASLASLKKVKVKEPEYDPTNEWAVSFDGSKTLRKSVEDLGAAFGGIDASVFTALAAAIKSGQDVIANYQALGNEFPKIDAYKRLAERFQRAAAKKAKAFTGDAKYDKLGKWYAAVGTKIKTHAETVEQLGDTLLDRAEKVDTEKITDLKWELNTWDLTHMLKTFCRADYAHIQLKEKFEIAITVTGKVGGEAANNATLRAEFFEAAYDVGKEFAPKLHRTLVAIDEKFGTGELNEGRTKSAVAAAYQQFYTDYKKFADAGIQYKWDKFCKDKKDYKKYKIRTGFKIFGKTASLGVSVATAAASGWTGVGSVAGIVASMKAARELGNECKDAWVSARELKGQIDADLESLKQRFESAGIASGKEVGGAVLEALTGKRTKTVATVKNKVGLFGKKVKGCHTKAVKMGRALDTILKEQDGLKRKLDKAVKQFKPSQRAVKAILAIKKKLKDAETSTGNLVSTAADAASDYREGTLAIGGYVEAVKALEGDIHAAANFINSYAVPFLKFAFVSDAPGAILTAGSVTRELVATAAKNTDLLVDYNQAGDIVGDVSYMIQGIMGT